MLNAPNCSPGGPRDALGSQPLSLRISGGYRCINPYKKELRNLADHRFLVHVAHAHALGNHRCASMTLYGDSNVQRLDLTGAWPY